MIFSSSRMLLYASVLREAMAEQSYFLKKSGLKIWKIVFKRYIFAPAFGTQAGSSAIAVRLGGESERA